MNDRCDSFSRNERLEILNYREKFTLITWQRALLLSVIYILDLVNFGRKFLKLQKIL